MVINFMATADRIIHSRVHIEEYYTVAGIERRLPRPKNVTDAFPFGYCITHIILHGFPLVSFFLLLRNPFVRLFFSYHLSS